MVSFTASYDTLVVKGCDGRYFMGLLSATDPLKRNAFVFPDCLQHPASSLFPTEYINLYYLKGALQGSLTRGERSPLTDFFSLFLKQANLTKQISDCFTLFICGGPCHHSSYKQCSGDLIFLWEQFVYPTHLCVITSLMLYILNFWDYIVPL